MDAAKRIDLLERQLQLLESFSVQSFWHAIDQVYDRLKERIEVRCLVCGHSEKATSFQTVTSKCQFGGGLLERFVCSECDAIFGPLKYLDLPDELVQKDYELLYARYSESDSTKSELRTFHSLIPRSGEIFLNWGCGTSCSTIDQLRDEGYLVWGYEPTLERSEGFRVANRGEVSAQFDGIFSNNVIEHFRRPVDDFLDISKNLKSVEEWRIHHHATSTDTRLPGFTHFFCWAVHPMSWLNAPDLRRKKRRVTEST